MNEFKMHRLGTIMEAEPGNLQEAEGVLNPAVIRGPDNHLYLFPRLVAKGNYSRIGIARVEFDQKGDPVGVKRLGIALEPQMDYELGDNGIGGCEDPRITFVEELQYYIMVYAALSSAGPRIALARSKDLFNWERIGLAAFSPYRGIFFDGVANKDACLFPITIPNPTGHFEFGLLHRPLFPGTRPEETIHQAKIREVDLHRESIWISYCSTALKSSDPYHTHQFTSHHRLASPVSPWERLKIGCGTPPILTRHGWLIIYHGVSELEKEEHQYCYSAGVMILSKEYPHKICYRSPQPVLVPELPQERVGIIANVVFPTGIDRRDDLGTPDRFDVYYGMADDRIGVARLNVPESLPSEKHATKHATTV